NRLTSAEAYTTGGPTNYKYRQQWMYDEIGNILQMNDRITSEQAYQVPAPSIEELVKFNGANADMQLISFAQQGEEPETPTLTEPATPAETPTITFTPSKTPVLTNTPGTVTSTFTPTITPWSGVDMYTVSMLHMDGVDGATTFIDETGKAWTTHGNAQIDTEQYQFNGASALFDGTGDYIRTPSHGNFNFGNGNFTIDAWVRLNS